MTVTVLYVARVCTCCALKLANDDTCDQPDDKTEHPHGLMGDIEYATAVLGLPAGEHFAGCNSRRGGEDWDCDLSCETEDFSRARCDGCGSDLAGTRHAVTVFDS